MHGMPLVPAACAPALSAPSDTQQNMVVPPPPFTRTSGLLQVNSGPSQHQPLESPGGPLISSAAQAAARALPSHTQGGSHFQAVQEKSGLSDPSVTQALAIRIHRLPLLATPAFHVGSTCHFQSAAAEHKMLLAVESVCKPSSCILKCLFYTAPTSKSYSAAHICTRCFCLTKLPNGCRNAGVNMQQQLCLKWHWN